MHGRRGTGHPASRWEGIVESQRGHLADLWSGGFVASAGSTQSVLGDGPWARLVKGRALHQESTLYCILARGIY